MYIKLNQNVLPRFIITITVNIHMKHGEASLTLNVLNVLLCFFGHLQTSNLDLRTAWIETNTGSTYA